MTKVQAKGKTTTLLKELCGDDEKLYGYLANTLFNDPSKAVRDDNLDVLSDEAKKSGVYGFALDKAIFDAAQNPDERERYITIIQDLGSQSLAVLEKEKEAAEKDGPDYLVSPLEKKIERQKFLNERTDEVLNIASGFYKEKMAVLGAAKRQNERNEERKVAEREDRRIIAREKKEREARKKERKQLDRKERKEALEQDQKKEMAAEERKEARAEKINAAEREDQKITDKEKADRESRKEERTKR